MNPTVNIKDIAKFAGVGVSTVSRVMNNHPDVNPETRKMVEAIITKYNYVPNNSARNLKRSNSKSIGVLIKGITNPFFSRMIKIIEQEINNSGYSMILHQVDYSANEVDTAIEVVKEKRLRGLIFLGGDFNCSYSNKLNSIKIPFVLATVTAPDGIKKTSYSSVTINDFNEGYKVADYICKAGHKKIAILTSSNKCRGIGNMRLQGYLAALKDNGITEDESLIILTDNDFNIEAAYNATKKALAKDAKFTCLFAVSDLMAIGASKAIRESHLSIPQDVSLIGFDGIEMAGYCNPPLTTVCQPAEEMAHECVHILLDVIEKRSNNKHMVFEAALQNGESFREI